MISDTAFYIDLAISASGMILTYVLGVKDGIRKTIKKYNGPMTIVTETLAEKRP